MSKKPTTLISVATLLMASFGLLQAQTVSTDPVGYVTLTINGTGGTASEAYSYLGVPLHLASSTSGSISNVTGATISSSGQSWTENAYANTHYILITSGSNAGINTTITSNTSDTLTTADDISSFLSGDETFSVHEYNTIANVFGAANESGLDGGSSAGNADKILIQTATGFNTYYYKNAGLLGGTGWRSSTSTITDASNTVIAPGAGIIVVRSQTDDINLVISGSVYSSDAITPVEAGYNWKTASIPVTLTLSGLFGANNEAGLDGGSSAGNADNVLVLDSDTGAITSYYYKDSGLLGGTGWRSSVSTITDQANAVIAEPGKMFLINRSGGSAFNLTEASPL